MTTSSEHEERAFRVYEEAPMSDGDALLLLDDDVCLEITGLADGWQRDAGDGVVRLLSTATTRSVRLAIARPCGQLLPRDFQVWRDLHAALRGTSVELRPLRALPAA